MPKFRKKPVVIEAEQFFPSKKPWPEGVYRVGGSQGTEDEDDSHVFCRIDTLEGKLSVSTGSWIVTGVQGERYPVKPDIFEATYEAVDG